MSETHLLTPIKEGGSNTHICSKMFHAFDQINETLLHNIFNFSM